MAKISLCMIVKNGREIFEECLKSIVDYVDEIVVVIDGESEDRCDEVAESFGANVFYRELNEDFATQRNYSFEQVSDDTDWILWLDSDDYVPEISAKTIRQIADDEVASDVDGFIFDYLYEFDEMGSPSTILKRERLLRKSSNWKWKYEIHEACIPSVENPNILYESTVKIIHRRQEIIEQTGDRDPGRNLRILEKVMHKYEDDSRMLFYAGNEYFANNKLKEAEEYYLKTIEKEPWSEQRYLSIYRIALIKFDQNLFKESEQWCLKSIAEDYTWAESYCLIGDIASALQNWKKAVRFYQIAADTPLPGSNRLLTFNPSTYNWYPLVRASFAAERLGDYDLAISSMEKAMSYRINDKEMLYNIDRLKEDKKSRKHDGLKDVMITNGDYAELHPHAIRKKGYAQGSSLHGFNVIVSNDIDDAVGKIAFIFDLSYKIDVKNIERIQQRGTEVILDIVDKVEFKGNEEVISLVDAVVVSSPSLLEMAIKLNENSVYIPDVVLHEGLDKDCDPEELNIMVATSSNVEKTDIIPLVINNVKDKKVNFHFVGDSKFADIQNMDDFIAVSKKCDFGICYFPRDNEYHSSVLSLQMMSMGLPLIVSANPSTVSTIDHNHNGILCYHYDEWNDAIKRMINNINEREVMRERAILKSRQYCPLSFSNKVFNAVSIKAQSLDVVIPCHGNAEYVKLCLDSLNRNSIHITKFILVSNPIDGKEVDKIRKIALNIPKCTYYDNDIQRNFSENCNIGIRLSDARHVCLLNSDTIVTPMWDENLIRVLEKHEGAAIAGCYSNSDFGWMHDDSITIGGQKIVDTHSIEDLTCSVEDIYKFGKTNNKAMKNFNQSVDWVAFFAVGIPRKIIEAVGELDESYNNDKEDYDYCKRLKEVGGKCVYTKGSFVFHFGGKSRGDNIDRNDYEDNPEFLTHLHKKERLQDKTIKIVVGTSWEPWFPEDLNKKGIGGAETCVVHIAKNLAMIGWNVEVYSTDLNRVIYRDGVKYLPSYSFDGDEHCEVVVISRRSNMFNEKINADLTVLYNHDNGLDWADESHEMHIDKKKIENIDLLFVLSEWHKYQFKLLFSDIPDDKFLVTRNGIDTNRFERYRRGFIPKDVKRFIYSSSADRGLVNLMNIWPYIIKMDPEFKLHLYYGVDTWTKIAEQTDDKETLKIIDKIIELTKQKGVITHGRIGQRQLAEEFAMSNLWLYPTDFLETSCITAMEVQAAGVAGITSPIGALTETIEDANFIGGVANSNKYQEEFIKVFKSVMGNPQNDVRIQSMIKVWEHNDWRKIAEEWSELFKSRLKNDS